MRVRVLAAIAALALAAGCRGSAAGGSAGEVGSPAFSDAGAPRDTDGGLQLDGGIADGGISKADGGAPGPDAGLAAIDPYRELAIVDSAVVLDARASNAAGGPWSFRWLIEQMAPPGTRPGDIAEQWLRSFRQTSVEGAPVEDRKGVEDLLATTGASAWPRLGDGSLDLAQAPFRLLAILNRVDLTTSSNGEARFVFGLVDRKGAPDLLAIAFEYQLPPLGTRNDRQEWARRWHALANHSHGPEYNAALEAVTRGFASAGVAATRVNGNSLAQIRTNEGRFGTTWEMRQWVLAMDGADARLRPALLPQTPPDSLNGDTRLARFITDNAATVLLGAHILPREMMAGATSELGNWQFKKNPEIGPALRHAFAVRSCNGCHASETNSRQGFFHINPFSGIRPGSDGIDRISDYLKITQMGQRIANLQSLLALGPGVPETVPPLPPKPAILYDVQEVAQPADSGAIALGAGGKVLGNSSSGPWIRDGSSLRFLLPNGSWQTIAMGFNSSGDVAGRELRPDGTERAFVLRNGARTDLGTLGGTSSSANAIDSQGQIAGDSTLASGSWRAFLGSPTQAGAILDLGTLGGDETLSFAINDSGQVAGQSQRADGARHPFLFDGRALHDLGSLGGAFGRAQAINDKGQTAGMSELVPGDRKIHAFVHDGSSMRDLGALPGLPWTSATGINGEGVVVGNVYNKPDYNGAQYETFAFVYRGGVLYDLNDLIPPAPFVLLTAHGINGAGQILCTDGQADQQSSRAWLLTPR